MLKKVIFFSKSLISSSMTKKFHKLKRRQLDIINDKAAFYDFYKFSNQFDSDVFILKEFEINNSVFLAVFLSFRSLHSQSVSCSNTRLGRKVRISFFNWFFSFQNMIIKLIQYFLL